MTNNELKKKICEIIAPYVSAWGEDERIADALIDANIFVDIDTLKDKQQSMNGILTNMSSYMKYKLHELKHRAEVAEKMFDILHEESSMYMKVFSKEWYKQQAEKQLAEERKDEQS